MSALLIHCVSCGITIRPTALLVCKGCRSISEWQNTREIKKDRGE